MFDTKAPRWAGREFLESAALDAVIPDDSVTSRHNTSVAAVAAAPRSRRLAHPAIQRVEVRPEVIEAVVLAKRLDTPERRCAQRVRI
jgi:hypothetical protein